MNKLEIKELSKHYEGFDLEKVSFTVPSGTVVGLIGENGAGKSTLIKSVIGAVHPDAGNIFSTESLSTVCPRPKSNRFQ